MAKEAWNTRANKFAKNVKKHLGSIKVLLLGPGYPKNQLRIREDVAKELKKAGCDIYIMEHMNPISSYNIDETFRDILQNINPDLIICIFTDKGVPHGVIFEVGFICGYYKNSHEALDRLRFLFHNRVKKIEKVPAYLHFLTSRSRFYEFYDEGEGPTLYDRILCFIHDEVVRQFCPA
jgi:hypothetical protein